MNTKNYQIVSLEGLQFKDCNRKKSFSDFSIKNIEKNLYGSFNGTLPYRPIGGKKALKAILENDNIEEIFPYWIKACEV